MSDREAKLKGDESRVEYSQINGQGFKKLIEAAYIWLRTNQQTVNALNVFPVPDGDTGTNMVLTMQAAFEEIRESQENDIGKIAHAVAHGALMGARGNSGVILSQIWRGFARALDNTSTMDSELFARALHEARETAYKGVVRPVEGTILTVIKDVSIAALGKIPDADDIFSFLEYLVDVADESVKRTPDLLPILKQANVVDSGGKGLFFILEGFMRYMKHESLDTPLIHVQPLSIMQLDALNEHGIEEDQDYEVVLDFRPNSDFNLDNYYEALMDMGTSIQVGEGDGQYRLHIHVCTENRYKPIDYTMGIGVVSKVYLENLIELMNVEKSKSRNSQSDSLCAEVDCVKIEPGQIGVIAISPGHGISKIFASLGVAGIVSGGQTMNPSTEEILAAVESINTDKVIILPNNKNIIMAAEASKSMSNKQVAVIPSKTVPQGLSAILRLLPDGDYHKIVESMNDSLDEVDTGEVTIATRSVEINGVKVEDGSVIALHNGKLIESANNIEDACLSILKSAETEEKERITLFYGNNISEDDVGRIAQTIEKIYPEHDIEIHEGGQPHYHFIIAVE